MRFRRILHPMRNPVKRSRAALRSGALRCKPAVESLEQRTVPATMSISSTGHLTYVDGSTTTLTVTEGGSTISFHDSAEVIHLSGAGSGGFSGNGTHTV